MKRLSRIIKVSPDIGGYPMICILLKSPKTGKNKTKHQFERRKTNRIHGYLYRMQLYSSTSIFSSFCAGVAADSSSCSLPAAAGSSMSISSRSSGVGAGDTSLLPVLERDP